MTEPRRWWRDSVWAFLRRLSGGWLPDPDDPSTYLSRRLPPRWRWVGPLVPMALIVLTAGAVIGLFLLTF